MARMELPENEEHLVEALDSELTAAESEMSLALCSWKVIDGYLKGARKFNVVDKHSGRVRIGYERLSGDVIYRHEDIVRRYLIEVGRWLKSDISPKVVKRGESLGDMRNAAIANAVLNARVSSIDLRRLKTRLIVPFVKYGIVGLAHYEMADPLHPDHVEVVPARQLRPLPAFVDGAESMQGIARKRWVPYDWLKTRVKELYDIDMDQRWDVEQDLMGQRVSWGQLPPSHSLDTELYPGKYSSYLSYPVGSPRDKRTGGGRIYVNDPHDMADTEDDINIEGRYYVPMEEVYPYMDDSLYAARYILKVGRAIVAQEDYEGVGRRVVCPLQVARYTDTGSFFSRGFVAPLIPANDQFEKVISSIARNMRDLDLFGTLFVSSGMNVDLKKWNQPGPRPRAEKYTVDPMAQNTGPIQLQPANSGLLPVRFGEFLKGVTEGMAGQGPFYDGQAAGRDIGAAGHGFLFNTGNIGLGLPSHNLADAISGVYARILQVARTGLGRGDTIKLATIDENLAGVVINPQTGSLELAENPVPNPWEVRVDVKDRTPSDPDIRKRELAEHLASGALGSTPEESYLQYWISAYEEGLDIPGAPKDLQETWRKAIWQIIVLFGDGETPGPVEFDEHTQDPTVHLYALRRFMNKIEFALASDAVQQEFVAWKETLESLTGTYPLGLPPPEDAAQMAMPQLEQQMMAQQQQQGGPGGGAADMMAGLGAFQ